MGSGLARPMVRFRARSKSACGGYPAYVSKAPPPEAETELHELIDYVMRKAPPHLRRALELCYWDGQSIQSIANDFGVSRFCLARELHAFLGRMQAELTGD